MSNVYALLIGINYYLPNLLPNGLYYKSLWGCVQDINKVDEFLRHNLGVPDEQIIKLTSSNGDASAPPEPPEQWPTYKNIVEAFGKLVSFSQPGDQIYIHYSGHGGRAVTTPEFRELKGADGIDEVLVPMDLGNSEGNYLRDTELQYLLQRLIDQNRLVTIVLDSCHAGGATRARLVGPSATGAGVRGLGTIDYTPRISTSLVASPELLKQSWITSRNNTRSVEGSSGWLLEPKGYVLIAACRASEYANEYPFNGKEKNGALSYWLLHTLKQIRPGFTYKMLHDRILAKVHGQFVDQTPQLQGEINRVVFGNEEVAAQYAVTVLESETNDGIVLNAGEAHDVGPGAKFDVFALYTTDFTDINARIAVVEVTESGTTSSKAKLINSFGDSAIEPGCQAVLFDRGIIRLSRRVRLTATNNTNSNGAGVKAITEVAQLLKDLPNGFIQLALENEPADYTVTIKDDTFAICDSGGLEIENLYPGIAIAQPDAAASLVGRLTHLAKYFNVRELDNDESLSPLAGKLSVEVTRLSEDSDNATQTFRSGETIVLRVQNNSDAVLNITVLNLQPDWGISQIYPRGAAFEPVDPGKGFKLPMKVKLPSGYEKGTDVIKVFATIETTSFRWFELPALLAAPRSGAALQKYLSAFASDKSISRHVEVLASPELEWTVRQVEIETRNTSEVVSSPYEHRAGAQQITPRPHRQQQ